MSYPVPRVLFDSIHGSLYAASRAFIRSLAEDVLSVPPAELLKRVLPNADSFKLVLYDTDEVRHCFAFCSCPANPELAVRCRKPVMPGEQYCTSHKYDRPNVQMRLGQALTLRPLSIGPDDPPVWVREDGVVINVQGIECGRYNEEVGELTLYEIAD